MFRLSAKFLVSLGLTIFLLGLLMLAMELKIVPNPNATALKARAKLCETVAISSSLMAARGDTESMNSFLKVIVKRDPTILSAGVRRTNGDNLVASTESHEQVWKTPTEFKQESRVEVPVFDGANQKWGHVELAFTPVSQAGWAGFWASHVTRLLGFVGSLAFIAYYFYLGKMLKVMNAKSVPQRVRTALNTLAGGLIVADANGDIVLANDAVASWVGAKPDSLMGKPISTLPWKPLVDGELPWDVAYHFKHAISGETIKLATKTGDRSLIVNSSPMVGNKGELRGVFIGLEDITVLEQKEVEHKKLREEAERANSAKSDFLARMSHEIRTPMNAILGFTDVLRRGFDQDAGERDEYLNTIHSSGEHLLSLINDILDLSKVESGRMELENAQCSPHKIILETLQVLQVRADEKGLSLGYEPEDNLPEFIHGDAVRMRQIVTNLVGNAIKFTETGGVQVTAKMSGTRFEFRIIDTGIGIKEEALERIFDPFSQADNSVTRKFGGTGLGLAIAKRFAEAMGGSIRVKSKIGTGTAFIVTIDPGNISSFRRITREEALKAISVRTDTALEVKLPPCKILIVDDGESNRKLLRLFLTRAGATLVEAENGQEAVNRVAEHDFDVILMDMQMPIMDGYTAASTLRGQGYAVPIVALTAHAMKQDEEKCLSAGCSHFLPKPVNSNKLLKLMSDIVGGEVSTSDTSTTTTTYVPATPKPAVNEVVAGPQITSDLPMDDEEFRAIVLEFVARLREQLDEMDNAFEAAEYDRLAKLAHWLKGSGGTAGFGEFTDPARTLENSAKAEQTGSVQAGLAELRSLAERIHVPS